MQRSFMGHLDLKRLRIGIILQFRIHVATGLPFVGPPRRSPLSPLDREGYAPKSGCRGRP